MLKGEEFLALGSNLIDPKGENNIKIANVLMANFINDVVISITKLLQAAVRENFSNVLIFASAYSGGIFSLNVSLRSAMIPSVILVTDSDPFFGIPCLS